MAPAQKNRNRAIGGRRVLSPLRHPCSLLSFLLIRVFVLDSQCTCPPSLDTRIHDKVKVFLLFVGYDRSRHTLMASLLDAHPNVIIANDFNILGEWIDNPGMFETKKYFIYEMLYAKSRYDVMYGVRSRMVDGKPVQYHYNIKGQWQGKYNNTIQVNGIYKFTLSSSIFKNDSHINH